MIPLCSWYHPVAQVEVEVWSRGPYPKPLIKWPDPQSSTTVWGSRNPVRIGDWLFNSCSFRMRVDLLSAHYIPLPQLPVSIQPAALYAVRIWFETRFWPTSLNRSPKTNQPGGGCWIFAFVLASSWEHRHEVASGTSSAEAKTLVT